MFYFIQDIFVADFELVKFQFSTHDKDVFGIDFDPGIVAALDFFGKIFDLEVDFMAELFATVCAQTNFRAFCSIVIRLCLFGKKAKTNLCKNYSHVAVRKINNIASQRNLDNNISVANLLDSKKS